MSLRDRLGEGVAVGLIAGEAGSGKTRLAARFAAESAAQGATVLYGCCAEQALVPYEPFADAVGESGLDAAALEERLAGVAGDRLFLVLDDLQWADRATLALLSRLVRGELAERLFVVGAYREDEANEPLFAAFADLRRNCVVERIELVGLGVEEMAALIGGAFETSAAAAQARAIHARSGGNPFYARELARHVAEHPRTSFGDVPEGIRDVVRARVERLSEDCASVLAAAAVLGESFGLPELEVVSGRDVETLEQTLDEAAAAGLIEDIGAGQRRFAHALTRDAVYAGLGASRRARLHRAAADALAARHGLEHGTAARRDRPPSVRRCRRRERRRGGGGARGACRGLGFRTGRLRAGGDAPHPCAQAPHRRRRGTATPDHADAGDRIRAADARAARQLAVSAVPQPRAGGPPPA